MKRACFVCLFLCLSTTFLWSQSNPIPLINQTTKVDSPGVVSSINAPQAKPKVQARVVQGYGKLPLAFEANQGQTDAQVKFLSRGAGYSLFFTPTEAVLALSEGSQQKPAARAAKAPVSAGGEAPALRAAKARIAHDKKTAVLRMKLVGANAKAEVIGQDELPGKSNYFIGNDPKKWHTNVRQFAKVRYGDVYPGVDLVYYGHQRELEYDFVLQPGANPQAIRLGIEGARRLRIERGDLVLANAVGDVRLRSPHVYQEANGVRQEVHGRYVITSKNEVGFRVGAYDRRRALVIDPVLAYYTYLGGSGIDYGFGIAVDSAGSAYVTGATGSADFPRVNPIQDHGGLFVTKFNTDGSALVYSTHLGGSSYEEAYGIAVDAAGNAYITGWTMSTDFPIVNAIQPNYGGNEDAFVTKINAAGSALVYSTYLGGSGFDLGNGIAADSAGNAYVTGVTRSPDFPVVNAFQPLYGGNEDAFVTKINAAGSAFVYSTYLGGNVDDWGIGIAADSAGNAYVTGWTSSSDFPTKQPIQPAIGSTQAAFVTKFNPDGSGLVYSTFLGGSIGQAGNGIAVDSTGNAYATGWTSSTDFPTVHAIQPTFGGGYVDAFAAKINAAGSALIYSTYLGGSENDYGYGIAADSAGNAFVTGLTYSADFPTANAILPTYRRVGDAFVTKFNSDGSTFDYSTYLGVIIFESGSGIAVDAVGSAYVTGTTTSAKNVPITLLAFQQSLKGQSNAFVAKIAQQTFVIVSPVKLGFKTRVVGTTSTAKITVTNKGSGTLTINRIYIAGANPGDFAETSTCGSSLAAGASCTVSVTFTPTDKNLKQAALGVSDSDPASPQAIALSGTGTVVSLSKTKLSFGDQPVGKTSAPQNVTLKNVGSTPLNFAGISITGANAGDFSQTNTCGTSIAAGANCTITVTFTPTAKGTRTAAVSISDDGGGSPQKVALTGTGT
jgi:hypothetical protein